ncbi:hypothetical protein DENSPDRAFT_831866 [Dentipellis sp. KUC8613]|nr:hypothetical protein DENSPDRAFT_831866 [Dentipellis sp. KUC8613]
MKRVSPRASSLLQVPLKDVRTRKRLGAEFAGLLQPVLAEIFVHCHEVTLHRIFVPELLIAKSACQVLDGDPAPVRDHTNVDLSGNLAGDATKVK